MFFLLQVDLTFRKISTADAAGEPREDARMTVVSGPLRLALSSTRLALVLRVAQRLAAATAAQPARPCSVFVPIWSSSAGAESGNTKSKLNPRTTNDAGAVGDGISGVAAGAASWAMWRPTPPAGYAPLGDLVSLIARTRIVFHFLFTAEISLDSPIADQLFAGFVWRQTAGGTRARYS